MRALRILFVLGLVTLGLCAAWPFRRPAPRPDPPAQRPLTTDVPLRGRDVTLDASPPGAMSPAAELDELPAVRREIRPVSLTELRADSLKLAPPPAMPLDFAGAASPAAPAYRTYRLRDGDTLESIAERYLGNRERAEELFALNRQALSRPDLLPVGTTIQIPPRE